MTTVPGSLSGVVSAERQAEMWGKRQQGGGRETVRETSEAERERERHSQTETDGRKVNLR